MDLFSLGAVVNILSLAALARDGVGARRLALAGVWSAAFLGGLWALELRTHGLYLDRFPGLKAMERQNVRRYLESGDPAVLQRAPSDGLPYPNPDGLRFLLDSPAIRPLLPLGIRPGLPLGASAETHGFVRQARSDLAPDAPSAGWRAAGGPARLASEFLPPDRLPYLHFAIASGPGRSPVRIQLEGATGEVSQATIAPALQGWTQVDLRRPEGSARLVIDAPGSSWVAVADPVELGTLSFANRWLIRRGRMLQGVGLGFLAAALIVLAVVDRRRESVAGTPQATHPSG